MDGRVIGINSAMYSSGSGSGAPASGGGSVGLGFAVPVNAVKDVLGDMRSGGGASPLTRARHARAARHRPAASRSVAPSAGRLAPAPAAARQAMARR